MDEIIITREEVQQAIIDNNVEGQLDEPVGLETLTDAFFSWLQDAIEGHILPDIDHWALGPNSIGTLRIRQ